MMCGAYDVKKKHYVAPCGELALERMRTCSSAAAKLTTLLFFKY